jgi:hypothetical protein
MLKGKVKVMPSLKGKGKECLRGKEKGTKSASYPDRNCTLLYFCTFKSTKPGT